MAFPSNVIPSIPRETIRSAKAVFGPGNFYIQVGEQLEYILDDIRLSYFTDGLMNANEGGALLPLVTFFEYVEGLTDDQAADAVRTRIDWKYALHLPVIPPVFHQDILCEFRHALVVDPVGQKEFQKLVDRLLVFNPPMSHSYQDFETISLISGICLHNRLNWILQAMKQTLGALAVKQPEWLREIMLPHWYVRFNDLSYKSNLTATRYQKEFSLEELGADIQYLLEEVHRANSKGLNEMWEIKTLRSIWEKQFENGKPKLLTHSGNSKWNHCNSCRYFAG